MKKIVGFFIFLLCLGFIGLVFAQNTDRGEAEKRAPEETPKVRAVVEKQGVEEPCGERCMTLRNTCATGDFPFVRDCETEPYDATAHIRKAAEQGDAEAQTELGSMYEFGRNYPIKQSLEQAAVWYRKAAEQGNSEAQFKLGEFYSHHLHSSDIAEDDAQAAAWYRKAAEQGFDYAQYRLGKMYMDGDGVKQDYEQAVAWLRKAVAQDQSYLSHGASDGASYYLGVMYAHRRGIGEDDARALAWLHKAADEGDGIAQYALSRIYSGGLGVAVDREQANFWHDKAAAQGIVQMMEIVICEISPEGEDMNDYYCPD